MLVENSVLVLKVRFKHLIFNKVPMFTENVTIKKSCYAVVPTPNVNISHKSST